MDGDSANGGTGDHGVHFGWAWGQDPARLTGLTDNLSLYTQHTFERDNPVFAMDQYGINHGFLMNGCRVAKDTGAPTRGGLVLPLDGVSQYVELHNSVNDFKDTAICIWAKWTGSADDQRVWSMGDGAGKEMYLTPRDATTGKLRFCISDGAAGHYLDGAADMAFNTWTHVAVVFFGATSTLYVDGSAVATHASMVLFPDSLNAPLMENANYLGRGPAGNYFQGSVDDFRVHMKSLTVDEVSAIYSAASPAPVKILDDTIAPTPVAATWLVAPHPISDNAITMTATPGTDASGWVEYYFTCTGGGGHDSGWVSFNKYTDVGLAPGTAYAYAIRMRDKNGNTTADSSVADATTQTSTAGTAIFAYGPVGIADGQITMTAARLTSPSDKVEYRFDRTSPTVASSGWQSSATWTQTGLPIGGSYIYTVTTRDGRGHVSPPSAPATAVARDDAAPRLPISVAHWNMLPYATIDNKVSMTAMAASDPSSVQYRFHCVSGGGPDSAWQSSPTFVTSVLADGTYVYQYQVRDTSARTNTSPYSTSYAATITPTTGYHSTTLSELGTSPDDCLVSFTGTVMRVNANSYSLKDLASGAGIAVKPNTYGETTDAALSLKNVTVKGHLYTLGGSRIVTFATVTAAGNPATYTVSGRITNAAGGAVSGATVYFSDAPDPSANPITTATTNASGSYSKAVTPGTWHVAAGAIAYNTSAGRIVTVSDASIGSIDFTLVANARILGQVTTLSDGAVLAGASVTFSKSPGASGSPVFTATTDAAGNYSQQVQDGIWYVCAGGIGYTITADKTVTVHGQDVTGIHFALKTSTRSIPRPNDLWFSAVTDTLQAGGSTGDWATYLPAGKTLSPMGSPTAEVIDGVKWEKNVYADGDGYQQGRYASPVAVSGVTIVAAVRPTYVAVGGEARGEIVDIFYDRLALAISHRDGRVMVARNRWNDWGPAIPNQKTSILSLVVQTSGAYKAYSNGVQVMAGNADGAWTSIDPDHTSTWGNDPDFTHYVNVGRNQPDGWSTFSGNIGDVFVYKAALSDADRRQLEADVTGKFLARAYKITVSAGEGGYVNPGGTVSVHPGGSQPFTISPLAGYAVANVTVDGVSQGAVSTYTFTNVTANHTLSASFGLGP
jgi:hypothetical protein